MKHCISISRPPFDSFEKRLVFFADAGGGPPESYRPEETGEAATGVSEAAAEVAAEERRQAGLAAKRQKKEEKKVKRREFRLAEILRFFIHGASRDDQMAFLLSSLLQRNTPVPVLLAVLSLNYQDIIGILEDYLEEERSMLPEEPLIEEQQYANTEALMEFGQDLAEALGEWTKRIFMNASFHPMKTILAIARRHGVDHHMIQLSSIMIQRFFSEKGIEMRWERVKEFSELFWKDTLKRLHHLADERGLLPEPARDPMGEEED